jgi:hypothetical protein
MSKSLSKFRGQLSSALVSQKWNKILPLLLILAFALTRIPGVLPENFSAAYALAFCSAVYFSGAMAWWLPLGTLLLTDIALNVFYYHEPVFNGYLLLTLLGFGAIVALGKLFSARDHWLKLLGGGLLGAILFYLISNTASWLYNPGYPKTLGGWIQALTTGLPGYPSTWTFFLKTLLSGGLFTGLFVGSVKLTAPAESPADKEAGVREPEAAPAPEADPEEANA